MARRLVSPSGRGVQLSTNRLPVGDLLHKILSRTQYLQFLARHVQEVGIIVEAEVFLLTLDQASATIVLSVCENISSLDPTFWVECNARSLDLAVGNNTNVAEMVIRTGTAGQTLHPRIEQILLRCFQYPPFPIDDREELIYASIFGFGSPHMLWESHDPMLKVLQYRSLSQTYCVSSGLSEPWSFAPANVYDERASGAGYELAMKNSDPAIVKEFVLWVRHIEQTGSHIVPGNWLEYENEKLVPGTEIAGFLVVWPTDFPIDFPVGSLEAHWHLLIPVTLPLLIMAKQTNVFEVAEMIRTEGKQRCQDPV
jgi:hypothetical protein